MQACDHVPSGKRHVARQVPARRLTRAINPEDEREGRDVGAARHRIEPFMLKAEQPAVAYVAVVLPALGA